MFTKPELVLCIMSVFIYWAKYRPLESLLVSRFFLDVSMGGQLVNMGSLHYDFVIILYLREKLWHG